MAKETKEPKKQQPQRRAMVAQAQKKERVSMKEYLNGVKLEMKKVVWPTKKELGSYTTVVLAACVVFALAFWAIDTGFLFGLKKLLGITLK